MARGVQITRAAAWALTIACSLFARSAAPEPARHHVAKAKTAESKGSEETAEPPGPPVAWAQALGPIAIETARLVEAAPPELQDTILELARAISKRRR